MALDKEDATKLFNELTNTIIIELKTTLDKDLRTVINNKFSVIFKKIDEVRCTANEALKIAKRTEDQVAKFVAANSSSFDDLKSKVDALVAVNDELKIGMETQIIKFHVLEKRLEDQTNRNSRKSLVFKGIPERGHESWDDTRDILAEVISKHADVRNDEAFNMIERCHRSSLKHQQQSRSNQKKGKRNVYCAFHSWDDSQFVLERFRRACVKGGNGGVYVEQKYGTITTARRNHALSIRKGLKADGTITNGYISYPARLMVKYRPGDARFTMHEDFSEMEVSARTAEDE